MRRSVLSGALLLAAATAQAQLERRRSPGGDQPPAVEIPRDAKMPYAGLWVGSRTMPVGSDRFDMQFTAAGGKYQGSFMLPNGVKVPWKNLTATSAGLSFESPNSGGGTWVYSVHLASQDSLVGTLYLRDAPPQFNPVPKGTIALKRQTHER